MNKLTKEFVLDKFKRIHVNNDGNPKYNYDLFTEYFDIDTKIDIYCPIHNHYFKQTPYKHFKGTGCCYCRSEKTIKSQLSNKDEFISKYLKLFPKDINRYSFEKVVYLNSRTKVIITCKEHGDFEITPNNFLRGRGCRWCKKYVGEETIAELLDKNNIIFTRQKKFPDCLNEKQLSFDFYLPDFNTCLEFNGIQHYKIVEHFRGEKGFIAIKINDNIKMNYCKDNDIPLIIIRYDESIEDKLIEYKITV